MKNMRLLKIAAFSLLAFTTSCSEEIAETVSDESKIIEQASVKNGRLYFPNKESLGATYLGLKNENPESVQNFINEKGIESLVPIITANNEDEVIDKLKSRKLNFLKNTNSRNLDTNTIISDEDIYEDIDDLEEIVGDEVYAAMLNGEAEIQVADNIYKYTDVGLFVTPVDNYANLENYLEVKQISPNLLEPTELSVREEFISDKPVDVLTPLENTENKINYFISTLENPDNGGETGGGGYGGGGYSGGSTYTEPSIADIVNGLKIGEVRQPKLGNLFGRTWVTDDRYEDRRRVKVKFYSQNLYLVYAIGCKVKHQYKGRLGWRKENADKLG